jgi:prepilin-type N-terminal cleavage/methylation domain-containing protein
MQYYKKAGFTLIELSIVIVIIGLIVAGVVAGQTLVKQSKLSRLSKEFSQLEMAFATFKMTYEQYPGDINNAYNYWGSSCNSTASKCNGDNSGTIEFGSADDDRETHRVWQHLALAELVNGSFTGEGDNATNANSNNIYYSASGLVKYHTESHGELKAFPADRYAQTNIFLHGGAAVAGGDWWNPALTVADAYNMDKKIDDGIANRGKLNAMGSSCSAAKSSAGGADYQTGNLSSDSKYCTIKYHMFN